jgi:hypothetical protein
MMGEIVRRARCGLPRKIGWRPDHRHLHRPGDPDGDHVDRRPLPDADRRVEALGHDVDGRVVDLEFEMNVGIGRKETIPHRRDRGRRRPGAGVDAQAPGRPTPLLVEFLQGAGDLGDRRSQPLQKAPPLVGQRDAACRAMQQADAEAFLQLSHRVAERRRRNADPHSRGPETELISDGDECRQVREIAAVHS